MDVKTTLRVLTVSLIVLASGSQAFAQKYGGTLRWMLRGAPTDLSIHESVGPVVYACAPLYSNLVWFDSLKARENLDTIVPDLAETWVWSNDGKSLTFKLRTGVTWHDGKAFTSADVKHTFDVVRGAKSGGLKLNPRKLWWVNIEEIVTKGDHEITFKLKRPQPSLLSMLATGNSPVYPAHVSPATLRTTAIGTGPFKLKRYDRDQAIEQVRHPTYFKQGRPYLDGVHMVIFKNPASEQAALLAKQIDAMGILSTPGSVYENLKAAKVGLVFAERVTNATINLLYNPKRPPMNNPRLIHAINLAMDRSGLIKSVFQGGAAPGTALIPAPTGVWGMTPEQMARFPVYGDPAKNKDAARRILAEQGYSKANPLKVKFTVRNVISSTQSATWAVGELKQVGIEAEMQLIETGTWFAGMARREFAIVVNDTAVAIDDPDAVFYETYACGSERNYTDYCNPEVMKKVDRQSIEFDFDKRHKLVQEIDAQLTREEARPYLAYRMDYYAHYPYVKNWVPHTSIYNGWKLEDVWLDR